MPSPPSRPIYDIHDEESVASNLDEECEVNGKPVSQSVGGGSTGSASNDEVVHTIARKETRAVMGLRVMVFAVLFLAALTVCIIVFNITASVEEEEYHEQYEAAANKVIETFLDIMDTKMAAATTMTIAMTAHGKGKGNDHSHWPFVTLPDFQQRAATARKQSNAIYLHVNPVVTNATKRQWEEEYANGNESNWIEEGIAYQENIGLFAFRADALIPADHSVRSNNSWPIWYYHQGDSADEDGNEDENSNDNRRQLRRGLAGETDTEDESEELEDATMDGLDESDEDGNKYGVQKEDVAGDRIYLPTWQTSPVIHGGYEVNENLLKAKDKGGIYADVCLNTSTVVMSHFEMTDDGAEHTKLMSTLLSVAKATSYDYQGSPISYVHFPVFDSFEEDHKPVAVMVAWIHWPDFFERILPANIRGIEAVLSTTCAGDDDDDPTSYTFGIDGAEVVPIGKTDLHDKAFNAMKREGSFSSISNIADGTKYGIPLNQEYCVVSLAVYPSQKFHDEYHSTTPMIMTLAVALVFVFAAFMFLLYDRLVEYRQNLVMDTAEKTNAIVTSLFPTSVRDRLMQETTSTGFSTPSRNSSIMGFLNGGDSDPKILDRNNPIADLFPHCTVLFADIAGFTAWSSTRDPTQVFILLQTLYEAFDKIAKRRRVFKVETIGDSYVAVTGLPQPQPNHAVIMGLFAGECKMKMNELVASLESSLGPDTGDLSMRFGMHSGPVTAGVLRGERARFQLFGDTVNTAARMESTGMRNKIQCSESTCAALMAAGKSGWLHPREDAVSAKGKGMLRTWWIDPTLNRSNTSDESTSGRVSHCSTVVDPIIAGAPGGKHTADAERDKRLVNWVVDLLQEHVRKIIATQPTMPSSKRMASSVQYTVSKGATSLDEVVEQISMPKFNENLFLSPEEIRNVIIPAKVSTQLHSLVVAIASKYNENPFHNFEHACHVTMATDKFLKRIVTPDIKSEESKIASEVHSLTLGINSSDPLLLFAILFSALIHDLDHRGVSNVQLAVEDKELAARYHHKSIAEQNSLDLAWILLMDSQFDELRQCLFTTQAELMRFRQLLVNIVLATDIFDKELNSRRRERWNSAFSDQRLDTGSTNQDLQATIVLEHIIQASDISHTMQHWHIYTKWNTRLFEELYRAYKKGRMAKDPSDFWYKGEIGFFDNYVIPLARKLKACKVFGVSSDECLDYAIQNRNEWQERGRQLVGQMKARIAAENVADPPLDMSKGNLSMVSC